MRFSTILCLPVLLLLAVSLVTNLAAGLSDVPLVHEDVLRVAAESAERMGSLIARMVARL